MPVLADELRLSPPSLVSAVTPSMTEFAPTARSKGLLVAWVVSFALIGAILASAYTHRESVMRAWPPSQRLYAAFGLH